MKVSQKNTSQNNALKNSFRKAIKEIEELIGDNKIEQAKKVFQKAQKALDKAAKKGVIKKNTAARKKSGLSAKIKKAK